MCLSHRQDRSDVLGVRCLRLPAPTQTLPIRKHDPRRPRRTAAGSGGRAAYRGRADNARVVPATPSLPQRRGRCLPTTNGSAGVDRPGARCRVSALTTDVVARLVGGRHAGAIALASELAPDSRVLRRRAAARSSARGEFAGPEGQQLGRWDWLRATHRPGAVSCEISRPWLAGIIGAGRS